MQQNDGGRMRFQLISRCGNEAADQKLHVFCGKAHLLMQQAEIARRSRLGYAFGAQTEMNYPT